MEVVIDTTYLVVVVEINSLVVVIGIKVKCFGQATRKEPPFVQLVLHSNSL
jgi:hypothetical protein